MNQRENQWRKTTTAAAVTITATWVCV